MAEAEEIVTLSTTTDSEYAAQAALTDDEQAGRVPVEQSSLSEFKHSESADGSTRTLSYEAPNSSRERFAKALENAERDLAALSVPEPEQRTESDIDIEAVRKAATEDAIAHVRPQMAAQQQAVISHNAAMAAAQTQFTARMEEIRQRNPNFDAIVEQAQDINLRPAVAEVLFSIPNGADTVYYLASHPEEANNSAVL